MTEQGPVLVATETDDATADMVIGELNRRSVPVVRFNPADLQDGTLTVSARFGTCPGVPVAGQVRTPSRTADLTRMRAVYWRRPDWPAYARLGADDARYAAAQARHGLGGTLYSLAGPRWVNHPLRNAAADHKPAQLALAQRLGLPVPATLITNDPDEARDFLHTYGQVIHKPLRWTPYQRDGVPVTGWAAPVTAEEINEGVRVTPHLFQARVPKVADLRVLVVGRRLFAVRIDSGLLDWRRDYSALTYSVATLPAPVSAALLAFLDHCHLPTGSFDLALDRAGTPWFLELNPNGQWAWLEHATGLPMAATLADLLAEGATP
ncbi:ATP-grasp ribosomal peptide maturase [Streptomyces albidoflavus]|uniref:ATP-grasp ribosomal peptide maturase n=1 Tax=Streptomyces albidoflavus TaxID=1886 RepID=UPI003866C2BE|nr:ATP-grasp ribosomal peptide maturase [Streptomyces albidoflavus]